MIKHDAQGFLVGDPIDLGKAISDWTAIREDVRAIRQAVLGIKSAMIPRGIGTEGVNPAAKAVNEVADAVRSLAANGWRSSGGVEVVETKEHGQRAEWASKVAWPIPGKPAEPRPAGVERGNEGNSARRSGPYHAESIRSAASELRAASRATRRAAAQPGRDSRGRFVSGAAPSDSFDADRADGGKDEGALRDIIDRIVGAVRESGAGMEEADPAIKAVNEVAQPMARGIEFITGGGSDKKQVGFLRRILGTLNAFRKEESAFNKAANRSLKAIENKPEGGDGSAGGGIWKAILASIMGIGPAILSGIASLLSKIPILGPKIGGLGGKYLAGGGGGILKGAIRKIPLLGALLAAGGAAAEIIGSESDDKLSRREKDQNTGRAIGGAGGTIAGMAAGAAAGAFAGPVGMIVGGMVGAFLGDQAGQIIGEKVGGWVNDLRNADIVGSITRAWDSAVNAVKSGWDRVVSGFTSVYESLGKGWDAIKGGFESLVSGIGSIWENFSGFLKEKFNIDVPGLVKPIVDAGKKVVGSVVDFATSAKNKAVDLGSKAVESAKKGAEYLGNNTTIGKGIKAAGSWVLGQTSKLFESGKGGAATVSSGKGDYGGASYGTYQLSSKMGEVQNFLKSSKYGAMFAGLQPGTPEFNAKWKDVARSDPEFGAAQHDYIKATKFDPVMVGLKKADIDLTKDGPAVQDAIWSTAVQFGVAGAQKLVKAAFNGKDVAKMTDAEKVAAIQDYKIANNERLFASSSADVRAGTAKRAIEEKKRLLALAEQAGAVAPAAHGAAIHAADAAQATRVMTPPPAVASAATPQAIGPSAGLASVQTAHVATPSVPPAPVVQDVAEAPQVAVPMAGNGDSRKQHIAVSVPSEVGQDVRDRGIAHIVTGGLGAA